MLSNHSYEGKDSMHFTQKRKTTNVKFKYKKQQK